MKTSVALATLALSASVALAGYDTPQQTVAAIGAALTSQKAPSVTEFLPASYQKDLADVALDEFAVREAVHHRILPRGDDRLVNDLDADDLLCRRRKDL